MFSSLHEASIVKDLTCSVGGRGSRSRSAVILIILESHSLIFLVQHGVVNLNHVAAMYEWEGGKSLCSQVVTRKCAFFLFFILDVVNVSNSE